MEEIQNPSEFYKYNMSLQVQFKDKLYNVQKKTKKNPQAILCRIKNAEKIKFFRI